MSPSAFLFMIVISSAVWGGFLYTLWLNFKGSKK